eukprot:COSAG06_NODE_38964_length_417_cov_3.198113_1_plen_72_part_01
MQAQAGPARDDTMRCCGLALLALVHAVQAGLVSSTNEVDVLPTLAWPSPPKDWLNVQTSGACGGVSHMSGSG